MFSPPIHNFSGKLDSFKNLIESYLDLVPDEPFTESCSPSVVNYDGKSSNSAYDWCRNGCINWKAPVDLVKIDNFYVLKSSMDTEIELVAIDDMYFVKSSLNDNLFRGEAQLNLS